MPPAPTLPAAARPPSPPRRGAPTCAAEQRRPAPAVPRPRPVASSYATGTSRFSGSAASALSWSRHHQTQICDVNGKVLTFSAQEST